MLRGRYSRQVRAALREADEIMPRSGDISDLLSAMSELRGREMRLLRRRPHSRLPWRHLPGLMTFALR